MKVWSPHKRTFLGVGMAVILFGASVVAIGIARWILNTFYGYGFVNLMGILNRGVMTLTLGYILLELEIFRLHFDDKKSDK